MEFQQHQQAKYHQHLKILVKETTKYFTQVNSKLNNNLQITILKYRNIQPQTIKKIMREEKTV